MKLYEIDKEVESCIDMETGEIIDVEKLAALQMERKRKIRNICLWVKDLEAEAKALEEEEKIFAYRKKVAKNKLDGLKNFLAAYLNGETVKEIEFTVGYRKSESVEIAENASIPDEFLVPQPPKVNKIDLKKAIKGGAVIDGVSIVEKQNIQIK